MTQEEIIEFLDEIIYSSKESLGRMSDVSGTNCPGFSLELGWHDCAMNIKRRILEETGENNGN